MGWPGSISSDFTEDRSAPWDARTCATHSGETRGVLLRAGPGSRWLTPRGSPSASRSGSTDCRARGPGGSARLGHIPRLGLADLFVTAWHRTHHRAFVSSSPSLGSQKFFIVNIMV